MNGAPMPLLTWSDFKAKALDIQDKVESGDMPPTGAPLSTNQMSTLLGYVAAGTPSAGNVTCP
ncbi:MAG: hypothetical protein EOO73_06810 [Myxococcales bacterium]|nr:MAG: hypothetical protein EOO73_06810 [Myxococcales bacterium]